MPAWKTLKWIVKEQMEEAALREHESTSRSGVNESTFRSPRARPPSRTTINQPCESCDPLCQAPLIDYTALVTAFIVNEAAARSQTSSPEIIRLDVKQMRVETVPNSDSPRYRTISQTADESIHISVSAKAKP
ncbi:unnamed protein product [Pleuronectes platessa]|uniref:Uncharacterized protein n=1 Tax=Pleuronectes platessa TaxID=8262 RepID=A0A9N7U3K2_PLEPL|nr:unnamed protein product [Pleuronectes platessa]